MSSIPKAHQLFHHMLGKKPIYVKGSVLTEKPIGIMLESENLYPVSVVSISVNETVNITYETSAESINALIENIPFDSVIIEN